MKRLFNFHYPKLAFLIITIILAYFIFTNSFVSNYITSLDGLKYIGIFLAGIFFAFGFTAAFSTGFFIIANPPNIFLAAIIGGLAASLADLLIFHLIRFSFMDEFLRLEHTKVMKELTSSIKNKLHHKLRSYLIYTFAGIFIATPLPDELGIVMLAGLSHIKPKVLAIISFILHSLAILILLSI